MNCGEAQLELALWVGHDLTDPARIETLRRHVAVCPACGQRAKSLQTSLVALGSLEVHRTYDTVDSLWPELDARIRAREAQPPNRPSAVRWLIGLAVLTVITGGTWMLWPQPPASPVAPVSPDPVETPVAEPVPPPPYRSPGDLSHQP